ncbi:ABC transporter permease subunit [Nonomuraea sp. NPDC050153]|uniref:ABC transporter permease subunit n=1 Tax=Nonomuraea sp. NPDC050153 TaxID=3364359 RepID=UPI0037A1C619
MRRWLPYNEGQIPHVNLQTAHHSRGEHRDARRRGASRRLWRWRSCPDGEERRAARLRRIAGSVVTETVFGRAGIGRLTEQAVNAQDTPVMLAIVVLAAAVFVLVNLVVDVLFPVLDPRLKAAA